MVKRFVADTVIIHADWILSGAEHRRSRGGLAIARAATLARSIVKLQANFACIPAVTAGSTVYI